MQVDEVLAEEMEAEAEEELGKAEKEAWVEPGGVEPRADAAAEPASSASAQDARGSAPRGEEVIKKVTGGYDYHDRKFAQHIEPAREEERGGSRFAVGSGGAAGVGVGKSALRSIKCSTKQLFFCERYPRLASCVLCKGQF